MSGLIGSILNSTTALKSNQKAVEIAGKNLANVNSTNYARQRVEFGISGGYSQTQINQIRDTILDDKIVREAAVTGSLEAQKRIYSQLQAILGEQITADVDSPETLTGTTTSANEGSGVSAAIDRFFNAFHSLATNPTDASARALVVSSAEDMVAQFNKLSAELVTLDEDVVRAVEADVTRANSLINDIASLNGQISKLEISKPGSAMELRDLRQQKLEELAKYIDFETHDSNNGQVLVVAKDKSPGAGAEVLLVRNTMVDNEIRFNAETNELYFTHDTTMPLGPSPNPTAMDPQGGSLHGLLHVRSTTDPFGGAGASAIGPLARMREELDVLAREVTTAVSGIHDDGTVPVQFFDDDDNPDLIDLGAITAANIQLWSNLTPAAIRTSSSGNAGANDVAQGIAELSATKLAGLGDRTFSEYTSDMAYRIGNDVSNTTLLIQNQALIETQLKDNRSSLMGVSIDEEMANILVYQRSFQASARVIEVLNTLLGIVVDRFGS